MWERGPTWQRRVLADLSSSVQGLQLSPDGRILAVACEDGVIRLLDPSDGHEIRRLRGHEGAVQCVAWSPNGRQVLSGGFDLTVRLWSVASGECIHIFRGHTTHPHVVSFQRERGQYASIDDDRIARLWDAAQAGDGRQWGRPHLFFFGVGNFSPDGRRFAVGCSDGHARVIDLQTWRPVDTWKIDPMGGHGALFSPDGRLIVTIGRTSVARIRSAETGQELHGLEGHTDGIPCAAFSPDSSRVVTASWDGTCRVWSTETGRTECVVDCGAEPWEAAFLPDGQRFLAGIQTGELILWSVTGQRLHAARGHDDAVDALAVSPDGRHAATSGRDGHLVLWDIATFRPIWRVRTQSERVYSAVFTFDGRRVIIGGKGIIEVWDVTTGRRTLMWEAHGGSIFGLALSRQPEGLLASTSSDGLLRLWPIAR